MLIEPFHYALKSKNNFKFVEAFPLAETLPVSSAAQALLNLLIAKEECAHVDAMAQYETQRLVFDAQKKALQSDIEKGAKKKGITKAELDGFAGIFAAHAQEVPTAPARRRYKSNDTTVEKLGELLKDNPTGLLVLRDELVGLMASWDREGREGDRAFYLEAWNGNSSFDTDRIGRGSIFIHNICVSIFGGIQPDKLIGYLEQASNALANDGMLQRFQVLVYPDRETWEYRDRCRSAWRPWGVGNRAQAPKPYRRIQSARIRGG